MTTLVDVIKSTFDSNARVEILQQLLKETSAKQLILQDRLTEYFCSWLRQGVADNDEKLLKSVLAVFSMLPGSMSKLEHSEIDKCLTLLCSFDKNEEIQADALSLLSEWHGLDAHLLSEPVHRKRRDSLDVHSEIPVENKEMEVTANFPSLSSAESFHPSPPGSPPLFVNSSTAKKKRVSFAPDDKLRQIREFISDQALEIQISSINLKPAVSLFREIPYCPPPYLCIKTHERGRESTEKITQQERIAPILEAVFIKIPDNPSDPYSFLEPTSEAKVRIISLGSDIITREIAYSSSSYNRERSYSPDIYRERVYSADTYKLDQTIGKKHVRDDEIEESIVNKNKKGKKSNSKISASPCAYFVTPDGCRFGDRCRYSHNTTPEAFAKSNEQIMHQLNT